MIVIVDERDLVKEGYQSLFGREGMVPQQQPAQPATPAASAVAPLPLAFDPIDQPALVKAARSVTAAEVEGRDGGATERLTLQLKPIQLGAVTAVLHASGGSLSVDLQVENAEAHQRLTHEKEAIGKALRDIGLDVASITIQQTAAAVPTADRDGGSNLSNSNGSRHESAAGNASEGRRQEGSSSGGNATSRGDDGPSQRSRPVDTGRDRPSGGHYI